MMMTSARRLAQAAVVAAAALGLAACGTSSRSYNVSGAPGGDAPACTSVTKKAPQKVAGHDRTDSDQKGTAVWGDGDVILRCGNISEPSAKKSCFTAGGVPWLVNEEKTKGKVKTVVSYGYSPAVDITVSERVSDKDAVLRRLAPALGGLSHDKGRTC
ncbi:DUF3515 family protein [Streptomyces tropicalis]|uniref:DUF3515 family protein n=1 Tax=Streptomyces tropicalis TaxID=3034234 RepID=A0ABT6A8P9_9ACTN|nr:DUF3515 family protein [Streptomyces tropicalis]MDF3301021.1 DUF3515 family protein [Streptomyces tropicalis]